MFLGLHSHNTWTSLKIVPHQNLKLLPQCSIFQYAATAFNGMKAFRDSAGRIRVFRPDLHWARFQQSCKRLDGAEWDPIEAQKILEELLRVEERWLPHERGCSLYIRAASIGAIPALGAKLTDDIIFFIILSPVGPHHSAGIQPISVWANSDYARTWYGATGAYTVGANYAIMAMPGELAIEKGCQQVLWLSGPEKFITEVGAMNFFGIWINKEGEKELITATLEDGLIVPGVTRQSVLEFAREEGELKVVEARWTIEELVNAIREKRVIELFGTGTVAGVAPVNRILYEEEWIEVGEKEASIGVYGERWLKKLQDIQYGVIEHTWSLVVEK
jgi:branched-chain amino acid aminotransferase